MLEKVVREGSMRVDVLEPPRTSAKRKFGPGNPPRSQVKELYLPC